jgi:hypothetical protein
MPSQRMVIESLLWLKAAQGEFCHGAQAALALRGTAQDSLISCMITSVADGDRIFSIEFIHDLLLTRRRGIRDAPALRARVSMGPIAGAAGRTRSSAFQATTRTTRTTAA